MKISQPLARTVSCYALASASARRWRGTRQQHEPDAQRTVQINSSSVSSICKDREVEMDEGYALTRKEKRRVCH